MKGKSLSKKAIITIVIIAILLIVAISMVVVFLKDQGKTEATAISENNSNSSQTEQAVQEENRREETNQPANEENAEAEVEQTEEITDNSQNVQTNVGTQQAQTTTTADADSQTTTIDTTVTVPTEEVNLGWSNVTVSGGELLANIDANVTDVTAPIRLATNILKNGESNDLKEYYVKRKDEILMYIAVNEELVHNPTFTLINDGKEYIMEDSLVTVRQDNETRWVYTVIYKIPENTTFVDGEITLKISNIEDKAGNKLPDENGPTNGHRVFYDGTLPEIHVKGTEGYIEEKENYVGNSEKNIYSKVSFKLKDNYKVVEYEVNDTLIKITPNSWTDANYANIKTYLVEGENTIIVRDIAGNEATYKFTYDSIAPVYSKLGILNKTRYVNNVKDLTWAKEGDEVRILISFPEKLAIEPKVKIFGKEYTATYRPLSSSPEKNSYYYMVDFKLDKTMPEGEITFEIYGYEDMAGNVGERLANQNINNELYTKVIIDNTAPKATVTFSNKNGAELTNQDVLATLTADEAIQNIEGWTRIDDRTFTKIYSVNGKYSVEIADLTGNTSVIRYEVKRIDKTAPEATVTFSNDNGATMTNQDVTVTLKANETIRDIEGWTRVNDRTFTKVYSENGKYSVEIIDKVGNTSTIKFEVKRIDKTAPVITLPTKNTFEVGVDIYTYPEAGSVYDESDKEISFSKVNIAWFKATANGEKGERVDSFEWNTSLKNRDLGTYYIEYWVADKAGNVGRAHRLLTLQDTTKPTIILNGENKQEIELGTGTYLEQGATVTDNRDEKVENIEPYKIDWYSQNGLQEFNVSKVDINKAGQYNVFYQYTDKAGNYSQIIRKVFVIDSNELELSEPKYTTLDNGNILVTIKANKLIKNIDGWKLSEDGKEISKEYTKNTDYLGEEIVISDIYGKTKKLTVKISDIKENGKAIVYVGSSDTLRTLAKDINNGKEFKNTIIKLTKNINLSGKEWTPIYSTKGVLQNATIDGNNFTITGMVTSRNPYIANGSLEKPYGNGFISDNTCTLTIKNIKFNNVTINDPTGGTGTNYSQHYQGTVVGHNQGQLKLENIKVTNADINGSWQCGGLVGFSATDLVFNSCTISDSYIGGPNATAGTIFGLGIINATMNNCKAENIKLYTDSLTFDTNAKRGEGFWVGSLYPSNGTKLTVNNSVETNVTVVDKK